MLIAQISDLHIEHGPRGEENARRLRHVIHYLGEMPFKPDLLIVSGDMVEDGRDESYTKLRDMLALVEAPILFAVGNHDRRSAFHAAFPLTPMHGGFIQYAADHDDRRILVLDTLDEGREGGAFCEQRAAWTQMKLAERPDAPTLIVLHHPPACTGIDWMDIHPDDGWTSRLASALEGHRQIVALIAGHVHRPIAMGWRGHVLTTTSSTAPQVALDLRTIDPAKPDDRALIVDEPPGLAFHRWTSTGIATHFDVVDEPQAIVRFDKRHQRMIEELTRLNPSA